MSKQKNLKNLNEENNKNFEQCLNYETCKGKWYKYRAKDDDGFSKACVKKENEKQKETKLDNNRNYIYDCKTIDCVKDLRF